MSVLPAASGSNIHGSETTQIPLLMAAKHMKMQQTPNPLLVNMMCLFTVSCSVLLQFVNACQHVHLNSSFLLQLVRGLWGHSPMFECGRIDSRNEISELKKISPAYKEKTASIHVH